MRRSELLTSIFLLGTLGAVLAAAVRGGYRVTDARLDKLPLQILDSAGETQDFDQGIYQALDADQNISRLYVSPTGEQTWLYVGYYGTAKGGRAKHQPQYCYPGSGWDILEMGKEQIVQGGRPISVNRIIVQKGNVRDVALYWNHTLDGAVINSGWALNWRRFTHRLRGERDDGAFIRISSSINEGEDPRPVIEREKAFAAHLLSDLPLAWPIEERIALVQPASLVNRFLAIGRSE